MTWKGEHSHTTYMKSECIKSKKKTPNPNLRKESCQCEDHLGASICSIRDIVPYTVRRPGAMLLNLLKRYIMIECKGGT